MKALKTLMIVFVFLIATAAVSAYPVTIKVHGNEGDFNTDIWKCNNADCSSLYNFRGHFYGNPNTYTVNGPGIIHTAEYDYDTCVLSHAYIVKTTDNTGNGPWNYNVNFQKGADCLATVNSGSMSATSVFTNTPVTITVNVQSPFNINSEGPQTIPTNLVQYYSSETTIKLIINGNVVQQQMQSIPWSTTKTVTFTYTPTSAGTYNIDVQTSVTDCHCSSTLNSDYTAVLTVTDQCTPNWVPDSNQCQNNDQILISYHDANSCGTSQGLPADNGTYTTCNFCTSTWDTQTSACIDEFQTVTYTYTNNCCAQTGLPSDCNIPNNTTQACNAQFTVLLSTPLNGSSVIADFTPLEYFVSGAFQSYSCSLYFDDTQLPTTPSDSMGAVNGYNHFTVYNLQEGLTYYWNVRCIASNGNALNATNGPWNFIVNTIIIRLGGEPAPVRT